MGTRNVKATGGAGAGGNLLSNVFDVLRQSGSMNTDARLNGTNCRRCQVMMVTSYSSMLKKANVAMITNTLY